MSQPTSSAREEYSSFVILWHGVVNMSSDKSSIHLATVDLDKLIIETTFVLSGNAIFATAVKHSFIILPSAKGFNFFARI